MHKLQGIKIRSRKMIGYYNYTVILTYLGLIASFVGLTQMIQGRFTVALFCLIASGVCDMFDGVVARTKTDRTESEKVFGIQIDSLCDLVCFGIFPAVFNFCFTMKYMADCSIIASAISSFYLLAAVIRLGYFNVKEQQRQQETDESRKYYQGMPVTTIAAYLPFLYMFRNIIGLDNFYIAENILTFIMGWLFILNIPVPKAHKRGIITILVAGLILTVVFVLQCIDILKF